MPSGRPKNEKIKKIQTAVALTPEIHRIISNLAKESFRSITSYIEMVLIGHIQSMPKKLKNDEYDKQIYIDKE